MEWVLSTNEDKMKLDAAIEEAKQSMQQIEDQKSFQKDVADRMKEELGIPPADFKALARERFKDGATDQIHKLQPLVELNEELLELRRKAMQG